MRDIRIGFAFLTSTGFTRKKDDPCSDCVIHSKCFEGYGIIGTEANSEKQGGVAEALVLSNQIVTWRTSVAKETTA